MNHGSDFGAIADDATISHQSVDIGLGIRGNNRWVKLVADGAVVCAFAEHRNPAEPRLHGFEHNAFVPAMLAMEWHAPFGIVIGGIEWVVATPWTTVECIHLGFFVMCRIACNRVIASRTIYDKGCVVERNHPGGGLLVPGNMAQWRGCGTF